MALVTKLNQPELDDLTIAAVISRLPTGEQQVVQAAWLRICADRQDLRERHGRRDKVLALVQEALSQLRLDIKYVSFDLVATRRERDALQGQIDAGS